MQTTFNPIHEDPGIGPLRFRLGPILIISVLILQFWIRYMPTPGTAFVADDWNNWARSSFYTSGYEAVRIGLQDPNRPLSMAAVNWMYRQFGNAQWIWTSVSLIGNSLLLLLLMKMCMEVTGRRCAAVLAGIIFAMLPNLTETYHWSTQVLNEVSCALVFYALSGWMWAAYVRRGGGWRLAVSACAYLIGLFSYEAGIFLPAAYLVLLPWRRAPLGSSLRMSPFGLVFMLYVAWRMTDAFGMNQSWHYPPHMEAGISLWGISWYARQMIHWWVGDHMFGSMLSGFQSFATLAPWTRRMLVLGNIALVGLIGWALHRLWAEPHLEGRASARPRTRGSASLQVGASNDHQDGQAPWAFSTLQVALFAVVWTGAAMVIPILSYTESRLMVLPAMGISMLAGVILVRLPLRYWGTLLFVPAVLALVSNQGTAESYRQVGVFNDRLYAHLEHTQEEWRSKEAILFDTRAMRNRLTPGLLRPIGEDQATWAEYNNALLLRGFVPGGMLRLITGEQRHGVQIVHDVEYGARIEGETLHWHERYNPARPRTTPMSEVFVVDVHAVGTKRGRRDET